ncbi:hypothetical protein [Streptosporangium sp. V21-05]|uniref:hypothetical protein n=1 Tax=Streptosporangium sp. V21-05 TaxID=3446115 RepID=UPI003F52BA44
MPPASASRCAAPQPSRRDHRLITTAAPASSTTPAATPHQSSGRRKNPADATNPAVPTTKGRGGVPSVTGPGRRPARNAATTRSTTTTAAPIRCGGDARNPLSSRVPLKRTREPRTNTTQVTASPNPPSQGVVARRGTRVSTRAIGTPMLQMACPAVNPTALPALKPSPGMRVAPRETSSSNSGDSPW